MSELNADLPAAYTAITETLEKVPNGRENLFMAKLALVLARSIDIETVKEACRIALQDIEYDPRHSEQRKA